MPGPDWMPLARASRDYFRGAIGVKTMRAAIGRGELRATRVGGRRTVFVCQTWLDEWMRSSPIAPGDLKERDR